MIWGSYAENQDPNIGSVEHPPDELPRCCIGVQLTFVPCLLGIFPWIGAGFDVQPDDEEAPDEAVPNATRLHQDVCGETAQNCKFLKLFLMPDLHIYIFKF